MSLASDKVLGESSLRVNVSTGTICALLLLPPVGVALLHSDQCQVLACGQVPRTKGVFSGPGSLKGDSSVPGTL